MRANKIFGLLILCVITVGGWSSAAAQECEYPLFLQQSGVDANVLFVFDNSGSMNEIVYHPDFDPTLTYSGGLETDRTYYVSYSGYKTPRSFRDYRPTSPSVYLISSDGGESGRYWGNYLNWLFYHATAEQRASIPLVTRVQSAKAAVSGIVVDNEDIRFGVMMFNYDEGGRIVSDIGSEIDDILNDVNNIVANTWTPLAETMVDALEYFQTVGAGAPITYSCQKCFIVCVTDGYPTMDTNVPNYIGDYDNDGNDPGTCGSVGCSTCGSNNDCTDYLDDVALYIRETDFRDDLEGQQNAFTYMVGFTIDAPLLQETAVNGGGLYMNANNSEELRNSLGSILRDIVDRISSGSAVAVVSTEGQDEDLLYRGKFQPSDWRGFLEAFALPYESGEAPMWEAGELLFERAPDTRRIFTSVDGYQVEFNPDNVEYLRAAMGFDDLEDAAKMIVWTMGYHVDGFRDRDGWVLGDVIDSSPVVVGPPPSFFMYNDYLAFREAHSTRERVVYIGSNDGMLHAFDAMSGEELWAYIPNDQLERLRNLADPNYCHQFCVNLTPRVVDAFVHGSWRTLLIGGEKQGGGAYFCIDVTYPDSPYFLWENEIPEIHESWARPEVYRSTPHDKFVATFGSGPDYDNGESRVVTVDLEDGNVLWTADLSTNEGVNMATAATTVDLEWDGYEDLMYISDLAGHLWRFDLETSPPHKSLLFSTDQPIQAQPILTVDYNNDVFLYFGTGKYMDPSDIGDHSLQTFYSIIDNHSEQMVYRSDLVDQTDNINPVGEDDRGWYIDLEQSPGERIVEPDALVSGIVYFTSFAPNNEPCSAGGYSWLYSVKFRNGAAEDGDDDDSNDTTEGRVEDIGEGLTTKPVIDIINENVIVQASDTRIHIKDTKGVIRQLIVRSWRQIYN